MIPWIYLLQVISNARRKNLLKFEHFSYIFKSAALLQPDFVPALRVTDASERKAIS